MTKLGDKLPGGVLNDSDVDDVDDVDDFDDVQILIVSNDVKLSFFDQISKVT